MEQLAWGSSRASTYQSVRGSLPDGATATSSGRAKDSMDTWSEELGGGGNMRSLVSSRKSIMPMGSSVQAWRC